MAGSSQRWGAAPVIGAGALGVLIGAYLNADGDWRWPSVAVAQDAAVVDAGPDAAALAERLYALSAEADALNEAMAATAPLLAARLDLYAEREGLIMSEEARAAVADIVREEAAAALAARRAEIVAIYAEELGADELAWAIALYESPEGRAFLERAPIIAGRVAALLGDDLPGLVARVSARLEAEVTPLLAPQ